MSESERNFCDNCRETIADHYIFLVGTRKLHKDCLTCHVCFTRLSASVSCYEKRGNIYCKICYFRLFSMTKCNACKSGISNTEKVMRAKDLYYHMLCFRCMECSHLLQKGEKFGICNAMVFCEQHFIKMGGLRRFSADSAGHLLHLNRDAQNDSRSVNSAINENRNNSQAMSILENTSLQVPNTTAYSTEYAQPITTVYSTEYRQLSTTAYSTEYRQLTPSNQNTATLFTGSEQGHNSPNNHLSLLDSSTSTYNIDQIPPIPSICSSPSTSEPARSLSSNMSSGDEARVSQETVVMKSKKGKSKRVRTTFKHYQLIAMKELFDIDKNPDSKTLLDLSKKIGLTKRVLQVWFQNARAKKRKGQSIFSESVEKLLTPHNEESSMEEEMAERNIYHQNQMSAELNFPVNTTNIPYSESRPVYSAS